MPYLQIRYPWRALVGAGSPHPASFYTALIGQALRYGLPASRRFGRAAALAGRRGVPEDALARALRLAPRRSDQQLDMLVSEVAENWAALARRSRGLPASAPPLSALALERRAARTIFLFGSSARPLLVLKIAPPGDGRAAIEVASLQEADPVSIAPRHLGRVGAAEVQEALPGQPLEVEALTADRAGALRWPAELADLGRGLTRLAEATAKPRGADGWAVLVDRAVASAPLRSRTRDVLAAAARDVRRLDRSVLTHRDPSPQNCLCVDEALSGLVDWETALTEGLPGLDVWIAALSYLEHSLGLVRWSQEGVVQAFAAAWTRSPYFQEARAALAGAVAAAGVPQAHVEALQLVFCGVRLGHRLARPEAWPTSARTAARTLELVAGD